MNRLFFSLLTGLAFTTVVLSSVSCNPKPPPAEIKTVELKSDTSSRQALKAKAYVCPMGMQCGQSDSAGKCPSCGMELKKDTLFHIK
jgi:hypothetical protein